MRSASCEYTTGSKKSLCAYSKFCTGAKARATQGHESSHSGMHASAAVHMYPFACAYHPQLRQSCFSRHCNDTPRSCVSAMTWMDESPQLTLPAENVSISVRLLLTQTLKPHHDCTRTASLNKNALVIMRVHYRFKEIAVRMFNVLHRGQGKGRTRTERAQHP